MTDFKLSTKRCNECLQLFEDESAPHTGLCPQCNLSFSISMKEKNALWEKQLELFLAYGGKSQEGHPDALVLWSGGSDSTLALYEAKYTLGLKVIALKFEFSFEREGMQQTAKTFIKRHQIPLITVAVDLKEMFFLCHGNAQPINEKNIIDFPWHKFSASGSRSFVWSSSAVIAKQLGISRIICGNNIAYFHLLKEKKKPGTAGEQFINQNLKYLNPARILMPNTDHLLINLPPALGYTKKVKRKKLLEIDYRLPDACYITTESDSELGLLLPAAAKKVYPQTMRRPDASAYQEFLSGYITREQWLEEFIKANNFSADDVEHAMQHLCKLIQQHKLNHEISITINQSCLQEFNRIDFKTAKNKILNYILYNKKILLSRYLIDTGKIIPAIEYAEEAINMCPYEKFGYQYLGAALTKNNKYNEALSVYLQGLARSYKDSNLLLGQATAYYALDQPELALRIVNHLIKSEEKVNDSYFLQGKCYFALQKYKKALEALVKIENTKTLKPQIDYLCCKCYSDLGRAE